MCSHRSHISVDLYDCYSAVAFPFLSWHLRLLHVTLCQFISLLLTTLVFSSVAQKELCPTLWDCMIRSTPGLSVLHQLSAFTQTHVHGVSDAIQPSHPLWSPSPPAPNPSQHQGLFQWVNSSHEVAKLLEFQLQHQSFHWTHSWLTSTIFYFSLHFMVDIQINFNFLPSQEQ